MKKTYKLSQLQIVNGKVIMDETESMQRMIDITLFNLGHINGVEALVGENEYHEIVVSKNKKFYIFTYFADGETGSTIGPIHKKVILNILSTVNFQ